MIKKIPAFARSWDFEKVTTSPKLSKVSKEYPALLDWRRTTTEGIGTIPVQRLMERSSKTLLATRNTLLKPKLETKEDAQALRKLKERQQRQSHEADHTRRDSSYKSFWKDYLASMHLHRKPWQQELHCESW